jgi:tetratricopeptide (TPR) repeat protein
MAVPPAQPRPSDAPSKMGVYSVERRLGRGGMATVYLGRDPEGKPVALKVMLPQLAFETSFLERFLREVEATRSLRHKNVVQVLGAGEQDGLPYMACEYVEGGSLETMLEECPKLAPALALEIASQLFEGLSHAHVQGIVHRDLKPANLLLTTSGVVKIADFGVAKVAGASSLTRTGALFGTPAYMSPEQAQGIHVDARSDLFSAGVILYELLTGINPHKTEDPSASLLRVQQGVPPIAEVDASLAPAVETLVEKLLEREPELRFQKGEEVVEALAPLVAETRLRHPTLLAEGLLDPVGVTRRMRGEQAEAFRARARQLIGESSFVPAALWLYRAVLLDPDNQAAQKLLHQVCMRESLNFSPSANAKVAELEGAVARAPDNAKALLQLAQLHRIEGNAMKAVACLKRVLRLRPSDAYVAAQLSQLTGERFVPRPSSSNLAQGIDTGGHAAQRRARPVAVELPFDATVPTQLPPTPAAPPTPVITEPALVVARSDGAPPASTVPTPSQFAPQPPQSPIEVQLSKEIVQPVATANALELLWRAHGKQALGLLFAIAVVFWAVRRVGHMIERATVETEDSSERMRRAMNAPPQESAEENTEAAIQARLAAGAREAAHSLEAASALYRKGDYPGAVTLCDSIIERYPKLSEAVEASFIRARAFLSAGRYGEAVDAFSRFATNHRGSPHYAEALLRSGEAYLKLNDAASARLPLDELINTIPDSPFAIAAYLRRGEAFAIRGDSTLAAGDFKMVLGRTGPADALHMEAEAELQKLPTPSK